MEQHCSARPAYVSWIDHHEQMIVIAETFDCAWPSESLQIREDDFPASSVIENPPKIVIGIYERLRKGFSKLHCKRNARNGIRDEK